MILLALIALCIAIASASGAAAIAPSGSQPLFRRSSDLGVQQCTFQIKTLKEHTLEVKAFAFLSHGGKPRFSGPQMPVAVKALAEFSYDVELRPLGYKAIVHRLECSAKDSAPSNPNDPNDVIPMWGSFKLTGNISSQTFWEFELTVVGFDYACQILAVKQGAQDVSGMGGLEKKGQTVFLLSPMTGMPTSAFVAMLAWHISWHKELGADVYVLYVTWQMTELLEDAAIQDLVLAGVLKLVMWRDLALPRHRPTEDPRMSTTYAHQIIIYNHGMLAMYAEGTVVVVIDLDEYLLTPKPTTMQQVMRDCSQHGTPGAAVGTLVLNRYDVYNEKYARQDNIEMPLWALHGDGRNTLAAPSVTQHPLRSYALHAASPTDRYSYKPIHQPMHTMRVMVHTGHPVKGAQLLDADPSCVKLVHLVNLLRMRRKEPGADGTIALDANWVWPAKGSGSGTR